MSMRILISSTALFALAACGGGSDGPGIGDGDATFGELVADQANFAILEGLGKTPVLPGGAATYGGSMLIAEDLYNTGAGFRTMVDGTVFGDPDGFSTTGYIGEASLTADFATGDGDGTVTNFYEATIDGVTGALTGSVGATAPTDMITLDGTAATPFFVATATGTVDAMPVAGVIAMGFDGPGAVGVLGESTPINRMTLDGDDVDARLTARK
ncbi:MAG: hypothetical protein ACR2O1_02280 [Boseongicola sp.]